MSLHNRLIFRMLTHLPSAQNLESVSNLINAWNGGSFLSRLLLTPQLLAHTTQLLGLPLTIEQWATPIHGWKSPSWSRLLSNWIVEILAADTHIQTRRIPSHFALEQPTYYWPELNVLAIPFRSGHIILCEDPDAFSVFLTERLATQYSGRILHLGTEIESPQAGRHHTSEMNMRFFSEAFMEMKQHAGAWCPSTTELKQHLLWNKSILLYGPSGAGKTHAAIQTFHAAFPNARILLASAKILAELKRSDVTALAEIIQLSGARCIIFDELQESNGPELLDMLAAIRKETELYTIFTHMTAEGELPELHGLRPERVGSLFAFRSLTVPEVNSLFADLTGTVSQAPETLTGATFDYVRYAAQQHFCGLSQDVIWPTIQTHIRVANAID